MVVAKRDTNPVEIVNYMETADDLYSDRKTVVAQSAVQIALGPAKGP